MSNDNWTGVDYPCFDEYHGNDEDVLECQEYVNPRKTWKCNWLLAGGHWHDCDAGGACDLCPESIKPKREGK